MDLFGEVAIMSKGKVKASKKCSKCGRVLPLWMYSNDKAGNGKRMTRMEYYNEHEPNPAPADEEDATWQVWGQNRE